MEPAKLVIALEALAAELGVPVRYDALSQPKARQRAARATAGGGLCRLRGQPLILIDSNVGPPDRIVVLAQALAQFDLSGVYVSPLVRAAIRKHGATHAVRPRPLARTHPPTDGAGGRRPRRVR